MRSLIYFISLLVAGLLFPLNAWAYLDPGTGSMILQGFLAGIAVAAATARLYWHKVLEFFGATGTEDEQPGADPQDEVRRGE